jgi:pSer/pThr/pTyr-binding forkhead associated (FHA) protein
MSEIICASCGHANSADARFCSQCGTAIASGEHTITIPKVDPLQDAHGTEDDTIVSLADLAPGTAVLVVRSNPQAGERFVLGDITRMGRHPDSEIILDDITVSRRHAEIALSDAGFTVSDAGSLNGTYVNQERIDVPLVLGHGDEVQVGKFRLVFFVAAT